MAKERDNYSAKRIFSIIVNLSFSTLLGLVGEYKVL